MKKIKLTIIGKISLVIIIILSALLLENIRYASFIHKSEKTYELVINNQVIKPNQVINGKNYLFAKDVTEYRLVKVPLNSKINLPKSAKLFNNSKKIELPVNYLNDGKYQLEVNKLGIKYKYLLEVDNDFSVEIDESFSYRAGYLHLIFQDVNNDEVINIKSSFKTSGNLIVNNDMYIPIDYDNGIGDHILKFSSNKSNLSKQIIIKDYIFNEVHFDVSNLVINEASQEVNKKVADEIYSADNINTNKTLHSSNYIHPSIGERSSEFGDIRYINGAVSPTKYHFGLDYATIKNTPVFSTTEGKVVFIGFTPKFGNMIIIDHGLGVTSHYYHLESIMVKLNDQVSSSNQIGAVGNTGYSTGPHLHFEIHLNGIIINPNFLIDSYGI